MSAQNDHAPDVSALDLRPAKAMARDMAILGEAARHITVLDLIAEVERLRAENARAVLRYTARGYVAGEDAGSKRWRERAEAAEAERDQLRDEVSELQEYLRDQREQDG